MKPKQLRQAESYNYQQLLKIGAELSGLSNHNYDITKKSLRQNKYLALHDGISCTIIHQGNIKFNMFCFIDQSINKVIIYDHPILTDVRSIINKFFQQDIPYLETLGVEYKICCLKVNLAQYIFFLHPISSELIKVIVQQFSDEEEIAKLRLDSFKPLSLNFITHPIYVAIRSLDFKLAKRILIKKLRLDMLHSHISQPFTLLETAIINKAPAELIEAIINLLPQQIHECRSSSILAVVCEVDLELQQKNSILLALLKGGANPNIPCENGMTPLMICARDGNIEGVQLLINHNADINFPFQLVGNPFMRYNGRLRGDQIEISAVKCNVKISVGELVPCAQSSFLAVPGAMTFAISTSHKEIIELLLRFGSDLPIQIGPGGIKWVIITIEGFNIDEDKVSHEMSFIICRTLFYSVAEELRVMLNDVKISEKQQYLPIEEAVSPDKAEPTEEVSLKLIKLSKCVQEKIQKILKIYTIINPCAKIEHEITNLLIEALTSDKTVVFLTEALQSLLFTYPEANAIIIAIASVLKADFEDPTEFILNLMTDPQLLHRYFQKEFDSLVDRDSSHIKRVHSWVLVESVISSVDQHVYQVLSNSAKSQFFIHIPDNIWQSHSTLLGKLDTKDLKFIPQGSQRIDGVKIFKHAVELKIINAVEGDLRLSSHTMYRNSNDNILIVFDCDTNHADIFTEHSRKVGLKIIGVPTTAIRVSYLTKVVYSNPLLKHDIIEVAIKLKLLPLLLELDLDQASKLLELIDGSEDISSILLNYFQSSLVINNPVSFSNRYINTPWFKCFLYDKELIKLQQILQEYNINMPPDKALSPQGFRQLALKLHPDKGGNAEDFAFVSDLRAKLDADVDWGTAFESISRDLQSRAQKLSVFFKILDTSVDALRIYLEPTVHNLKALALDSAHLSSMTFGFSKISTAATLIFVSHTYYSEGLAKAVAQGAIALGYMAVPYALTFTGIPYLGFAHGVGIASYSSYHAFYNAYSLYREYTSEQSALKSVTSYMDMFKWAASFKQDWFEGKALEYEIKVNLIKLQMEREAYKEKLKVKGEFGQKLYDHIYNPALQKKYSLLNKVALKELELEAANKQISSVLVKFNALEDYDLCREVPSNDDNLKHYYCANEAKQLLQHIAITAVNTILILEDL